MFGISGFSKIALALAAGLAAASPAAAQQVIYGAGRAIHQGQGAPRQAPGAAPRFAPRPQFVPRAPQNFAAPRFQARPGPRFYPSVPVPPPVYAPAPVYQDYPVYGGYPVYEDEPGYQAYPRHCVIRRVWVETRHGPRRVKRRVCF